MNSVKSTVGESDCWLSPNGEFYNGDAHDNSALDILTEVYGFRYDPDKVYFRQGDVLENLGWVRLTASLMWDVRTEQGYWSEKHLTQAQMDALWDWCKEHEKEYPYKGGAMSTGTMIDREMKGD